MPEEGRNTMCAAWSGYAAMRSVCVLPAQAPRLIHSIEGALTMLGALILIHSVYAYTTVVYRGHIAHIR